jgi:hypothetical protein
MEEKKTYARELDNSGNIEGHYTLWAKYPTAYSYPAVAFHHGLPPCRTPHLLG